MDWNGTCFIVFSRYRLVSRTRSILTYSQDLAPYLEKYEYLLTLLTYSMEQSPREANRFSVSQEILRIVWNPKVLYRLHKCPPPVPILSQPEYQSRSEALGNISQQDTFFYCVWVVSTSPNPQAAGPPLVSCPRLLFQYIRSFLPYWRPFLHPQPEDAPSRSDRDSLITESQMNAFHIRTLYF